MPAICVIVSTFNRAHILGDFLNRLEAHLINTRLDVEIVLVDNNSSDHTPRIIEQFKTEAALPVTTVHEAKQGANHARNAGIRCAQSEILIFTDDDVDFSDHWIDNYSDYMNQHPECQVASGKVVPKFLSPRPAWLTDSMLPVYGRQEFGQTAISFQFPDFPVEMNMAVRAQVFQRHGEFCTTMGRDAKTLMSNDGKLFFYRLAQHREIVTYIPDACLFHLIPEDRITPSWVVRRYFWQGISDVAFQHLVSPSGRLSEAIRAVPELVKLANRCRGGHVSPRRIRWFWHGLPIASKAWYAYQWGALSRIFGLK